MENNNNDNDKNNVLNAVNQLEDESKEKKFDNDAFEKEKIKQKNIYKQKISDRLKYLNNKQYKKSLTDLTISETLNGIQDSWFEILDDILNQQTIYESFSKDNRLYFVGITIFFFAFILYYYFIIFEIDD